MYSTISNIRFFFVVLIILVSANLIQAGQEAEIAEICQELSSTLHSCTWTCFPSSWTNPGCGPNTVYCAKQRCSAGWQYQCCYYPANKRKRNTRVRSTPSFWKSLKLSQIEQQRQAQGQKELLGNPYNRTLYKNSEESSSSREIPGLNFRKPLLPYIFPIGSGIEENGNRILDYIN